MTDEELAEAWVTANTGFNPKEPLGKIAVRTFLAGLKAGRPQWHNLKENPNDLPKEYDIIRKAFGIYPEQKSYHRVLNQDGCFVHRIGSDWYYIYEEDADDESWKANVTAWKEIILPKEEDLNKKIDADLNKKIDADLNKKIDADLNAIFDVTSIMNFQFDLLRKAYLKGIETGMMMHE